MSLNASTHLRGSVSGLLFQAACLIVGLLLTPVILTTLGAELYGVWALLNVLTTYESVSDLGIPAAIVVFVNKNRNTEAKNRLITVGVLANVALTLLVILLLIAFKSPIIRLLFKVPPQLVPATELAYSLTLGALVLMVLARSLSAVLDAFQRVDIRFAVETIGMLAWAGITWGLLHRGFGLSGVVSATLIVAGLRVVVMAAATQRILPQLRFRLALSRDLLSEILGYGIKVQGASLGVSLSDPLLKSLAGAGLTTTEVGAIQVGGSVASVPNSLAHSAIANLFPAIAERHGAEDRAGAGRLASRYLLYVIAFVVPITVLFLFSAPSLVRLWLGDSYPLIVASMRLLALAYAFRALAMVPWRVSWGLGSPQDSSIAMILHLLLLAAGGGGMLVLSSFSYRGILLVYLCSYGISALYLFWCMQKRLPGFYSVEFRWLLQSAGWVLLVSVSGGILYQIIGSMGLPSDLHVLLADALVLIFSYVVILVLAIPEAEKDVLHQLLRSPVQRLRALAGRSNQAIDHPGTGTDEPFERM